VTERDFWGIMAILAMLALGQVLQSRIAARQDEAIRYLLDNTVTRETIQEG
jgi:hypothetical protein